MGWLLDDSRTQERVSLLPVLTNRNDCICFIPRYLEFCSSTSVHVVEATVGYVAYKLGHVFWQVGARNNVGDMEKDPFYKFISKTYPIHPIILGAALYALGGFPYIVWGMVMSHMSVLCLASLKS
jgi:hypothetical protein